MLDPIVSIRLSDLNSAFLSPLQGHATDTPMPSVVELVQQASVSSLHYSGMPSITTGKFAVAW